MKTRLAPALAAAALLVPTFALGCPGTEGRQHAWRPITIPVLAALLEGTAPVTVVDANTPKTRAQLGTIPGATLVDSPKGYDLAAALPQDKAGLVVFYCANARCTASHKAAERAVEAGWSNVYILPDGIKGWAEAGRKTDRPGRT